MNSWSTLLIFLWVVFILAIIWSGYNHQTTKDITTNGDDELSTMFPDTLHIERFYEKSYIGLKIYDDKFTVLLIIITTWVAMILILSVVESVEADTKKRRDNERLKAWRKVARRRKVQDD